MDTEKNRVTVELHSRIDDNSGPEESTTKTTGTLYTKENMDVLTYMENLEEQGSQAHTVQNLLTIQLEKVTVKRSGAVQMHQQFLPERTTECLLQHAYGSIHMETYTNAIHYQAVDSQGSGRLTIDYTVTLNGQETRNQQLTWTLSRNQ